MSGCCFLELTFVDGAGAPHIRSAPLCVLGNAITSRMLLMPRRIMISRSTPSAIPPCGGAPNLQGIEQEAEFQLLGGVVDAQQCEDLLLHVHAMNTNAPAADLRAVDDDVVGLGFDRFDGGAVGAVELGQILVQRCGERVMRADVSLFLFVVLEQREIDDPEPGEFGARLRAACPCAIFRRSSPRTLWTIFGLSAAKRAGRLPWRRCAR